MSSFIMEPSMLHPLTLHLNPVQHPQRLPPLTNLGSAGYSPYFAKKKNDNHGNEHTLVEIDDDDNEEGGGEEEEGEANDDDIVIVDDEVTKEHNNHHNNSSNSTSSGSSHNTPERSRPATNTAGHTPTRPANMANTPEMSTSKAKYEVSMESRGAESEQKRSPSQKESSIHQVEYDLLKENRELRKKVENLMRHNMKLMQAVKDRDHKLYKQKLRLSKYRKALLRFFEQAESASDESDQELSDSSEERKGTTASIKKESTPNSYQAPPVDTTPALASPNSTADYDFEVDLSPASTNSRKRKHDGGGDSTHERKRRAGGGSRRNALWSADDDERFSQAYNTFGKSWKSIHECLPDKTREQVQSHGQYLIRIGKLEDIKGNSKRGRKGHRHKDQPASPQSPNPNQAQPQPYASPQ